MFQARRLFKEFGISSTTPERDLTFEYMPRIIRNSLPQIPNWCIVNHNPLRFMLSKVFEKQIKAHAILPLLDSTLLMTEFKTKMASIVEQPCLNQTEHHL